MAVHEVAVEINDVGIEPLLKIDFGIASRRSNSGSLAKLATIRRAYCTPGSLQSC